MRTAAQDGLRRTAVEDAGRAGDRPPRRGLVIGAGGAVGGAWALGVLRALEASGSWTPSSCEVVVGTSAGSVLAALIGSRVAPEVMVQTLTGASRPGGDGIAPDGVPDHVHRALTGIPRPLPLPGNLRLAARALARPGRRSVRTAAAALAPRGRGDLTPVGTLVSGFCGDPGWPVAPRTWLVAMDFDSGRRVVFGAEGEPVASVAEAATASCSVPGLFPPVVIGGRRYVDGGAVSVSNADLLVAEHLDEVVVVAPMATAQPDPRRSAAALLDARVRHHLTARLRWEVARLAADGTAVRVFAPTGEDLVAMGTSPFDASRRWTVYETAVRTTTAVLAAGDAGARVRGGAA
ncbi:MULTISPECIES: patatin-like phospholipase family protein [unclassified Blastococcus]